MTAPGLTYYLACFLGTITAHLLMLLIAVVLLRRRGLSPFTLTLISQSISVSYLTQSRNLGDAHFRIAAWSFAAYVVCMIAWLMVARRAEPPDRG